MRIPKRNPTHDEEFIIRPDLTQILHFSPSVPIALPQPNPNEAVQMTTPQIPTPILQTIPTPKTSKRQLTISDTSDSDTSSVRISKGTLKQKKSSQSLVRKIRITEGYSTEIHESNTDFIGQVSPRNPNERSTEDPKSPKRNDGLAGRK